MEGMALSNWHAQVLNAANVATQQRVLAGRDKHAAGEKATTTTTPATTTTAKAGAQQHPVKTLLQRCPPQKEAEASEEAPSTSAALSDSYLDLEAQGGARPQRQEEEEEAAADREAAGARDPLGAVVTLTPAAQGRTRTRLSTRTTRPPPMSGPRHAPDAAAVAGILVGEPARLAAGGPSSSSLEGREAEEASNGGSESLEAETAALRMGGVLDSVLRGERETPYITSLGCRRPYPPATGKQEGGHGNNKADRRKGKGGSKKRRQQGRQDPQGLRLGLEVELDLDQSASLAMSHNIRDDGVDGDRTSPHYTKTKGKKRKALSAEAEVGGPKPQSSSEKSEAGHLFAMAEVEALQAEGERTATATATTSGFTEEEEEEGVGARRSPREAGLERRATPPPPRRDHASASTSCSCSKQAEKKVKTASATVAVAPATAAAPQQNAHQQHQQQRKANAKAASGEEVEVGIECLSDELLHKIVCHLDPVSALSMKSTNKHFREIIGDSRVWRNAMENYVGEECTAHLSHSYPDVSMDELAKQVVTLKGLKWTHKKVGGKVAPSRCNFSSCAVGSKIVIFGGDHCQQALNDTHVLDLTRHNPRWKKLEALRPRLPPQVALETAEMDGLLLAAAAEGGQGHGPNGQNGPHGHSGEAGEAAMDLPLPPGRFGHTIRALDGRYVVLFGGCGNSGLYNDTWLLDMEAPVLAWRRVEVEGDRPVARVWHAACVVEGSKLVVFGGCDSVGELLDDTHVLDLQPLKQRSMMMIPGEPHLHGAAGGAKALDSGGLAAGANGSFGSSGGTGAGTACRGSPPRCGGYTKECCQQQQGQAAGAEGLSPVSRDAPVRLAWRKVETSWKPPARIGHSLVTVEGTRVMAFGGIANIGPVRARDNSSFVIDIGLKEPQWTKLKTEAPSEGGRDARAPAPASVAAAAATAATDDTASARRREKRKRGSRERDGSSTRDRERERDESNQLPSPRLDHVCWKVPGNRQIVFGGSPSVFGFPFGGERGAGGSGSGGHGGSNKTADMFLLKTSASGLASWKRIDIQGVAPQCAWTHCACMMDHGTKCVVLGGAKGQDWMVNELSILSIL